MSKGRSRFVLTTGVGFVVCALLLSVPSPAVAQTRRHMDLLACTENGQRLREDTEKALSRFRQILALQSKTAPWSPRTCEALRHAIAVRQRGIDWQGQESRACTERFRSPAMQQVRADLQDANDTHRKMLREKCG